MRAGRPDLLSVYDIVVTVPLCARAQGREIRRRRLTSLSLIGPGRRFCCGARRLLSARPGSSIWLPGVMLMRQRPRTAKGIVFVTLEDEFGAANLVIYPDVGERDRVAMIGVSNDKADYSTREMDPSKSWLPSIE
jgi:hypothetical protein